MTNKRRPITRNLKWLYPALLKAGGELITVKELVGFYNRYEEFRNEIINNRAAPGTLKASLVPIKKPKYVQWIESFLVEEEE